jgi:hypothetical protein
MSNQDESGWRKLIAHCLEEAKDLRAALQIFEGRISKLEVKAAAFGFVSGSIGGALIAGIFRLLLP